jgi:hypothetical protein
MDIVEFFMKLFNIKYDNSPPIPEDGDLTWEQVTQARP